MQIYFEATVFKFRKRQRYGLGDIVLTDINVANLHCGGIYSRFHLVILRFVSVAAIPRRCGNPFEPVVVLRLLTRMLYIGW